MKFRLFKSIKTYWQKNKRRLEFFSVLFLFVIAILLFGSGFHAVDLCRNELDIERTINSMLEEENIITRFSISEGTGIGDKEYNIANGECHIYGMIQIEISSAIFISLIMLFFTVRYADEL